MIISQVLLNVLFFYRSTKFGEIDHLWLIYNFRSFVW